MSQADALFLIARIEGDLAALRELLAPTCADPVPEPESWLSSGQIAQRLGVSKAYAAKLMRSGLRQGLDGFRKPAGSLAATIDAVRALRGF